MADGKAGASFHGGSDMIYDHSCTPCENDDLNAEALYYCAHCCKQYCTGCEKYHRRFFKDHGVLGKGQIKNWGKVNTGELRVISSDMAAMKLTAVSDKGGTSSTNVPQDQVQGRKTQSLVYKVQSSEKHNVKVKSDNDKEVCFIHGSCSLPNNTKVIVDNKNANMKLLDENYKVTSHFDLPFAPWSVCNVQGHRLDGHVAIAMSYRSVQFVSVRNGDMKLARSLDFDHICHNIAYHNNQLYVSTYTALYVYTLSGQLVKTLYEEQSDKNDSITKFTISDDGSRIYMVGYATDTLTTLDDTGKKLATFTDSDLKGPYDVCVAGNGTVLVCGYSSHNVLQVDRNGQQKLAIVANHMDKIYGPSSILFDRTTSELVVGGLNNDVAVLKLV